MIFGEEAVGEGFCCMDMLGPAFSQGGEHSLHSAKTSRITETAGLMALRWRA